MSLPPTFCRYIIVGDCPWGDRCKFRHDIVGCSCGLVVQLQYLRSHTRGPRHRQLLAEAQARKEADRYKEEDVPPAPSTRGHADTREETKRCPTCRKHILASQYDIHMNNHAQQQRLREIQETILENEQDKGGMAVTWPNGVDFAVVESNLIVEVEVPITNTTTQGIVLQTCRIGTQDAAEHEKFFTARLMGKSKLIQPTATRKIRIRFSAADPGRYEDTLELVFAQLQPRSVFLITRKVFATVGDPDLHERLKPEAPYSRKSAPNINLTGNVVPSTRPPEWTKTKFIEKLPDYDVPPYVIEAAFGKKGGNAVQNIRRLMPQVFNTQSYGAWFQYLLYVEEEQLRQDLRQYAMTGVEIRADYPKYILEIKGLAEGRPSVLVGDHILLSRTGEGDEGRERNWHEGRVQKVLLDRVHLRFGEGFSAIRGTKFDVQFVFNRICYRRMYHILNNKNDQPRLLFPGPEHLGDARPATTEQKESLVLYNRQLDGDDEQLGAIAAILNMRPGSVPFIVFGPPGTGKTVTLVESIQQILHSNPHNRILACAPNNSAADLIVQKLMHLGSSVVFRLNAITRSLEDYPKTLKPFSLINENTVFAIPNMGELAKYRVVVSTCLSGGLPASLGLRRGHFSHIFIDEAGQGKEPELMVPIKSIANEHTNIVLAGDNQQLGPIVHSSSARTLGLKKSYLARLMALNIYDVDGARDMPGGRGITIVKLIKNFRSHPAILQFANERFYKSELQPCGDEVMVRSLENLDDLPKKGFPIIFHGIVGKDEQEKSSPSFFNADEAIQVKKYCESLVNDRKNGIRAEDIGVITPYHAQKWKIKHSLKGNSKLEGITVGNVETFQGQERRVIIISTVRSNKNHITADMRRALGFVADARRFNVAITRAQALLIVVGNPLLLSLDPLWRAFMNYIYLRGGWRGIKIDWDPSAPIDTTLTSYDAERKLRTVRDSEEMVTRLRALISRVYEDEDLDINSLGADGEDGDEDGVAAATERSILREAE